MKALSSLSTWWQRSDDCAIALDGERWLNTQMFKHRVSIWEQTLKPYPYKKWAVYHDDAAEFLAIVCALWQLSKTACIPGDNLPETVKRLTSCVDGFVGQFSRVTVHPKDVQSTAEMSWQKIAQGHAAIEVYTSGSSGEPKAILKSMQMLESELEALDKLMPETPSETVLATVTHQHFYGFIFRLLRPFCYQQAFCRYLYEYPEDLIAAAKKSGSFTLVSSPVHLSRMNHDQDWQLIEKNCIAVYSAAAPLSREQSINASTCLAAEVTEIYGSSETGAIAWRCQQHTQDDALWKPLQHVVLEHADNGTLDIVMCHSNERLNLADQVVFNHVGQFSLFGRIDHIVKVEGKRLSLTEMQTILEENAWVDTAKALVLTRVRNEVAVAIILTEIGQSFLNEYGRKSLIAELKQLLRTCFEAVLLPRRWRFVETLPINNQGKLPQPALIAMFDKQDCKWPSIIEADSHQFDLKLTCYIPKELVYFDGHFDSQAVLPGVVQVHWAAHYGSQMLPENVSFKRIEALKFSLLLLPEQAFFMTLKYDVDKQKLFFKFHSERGVHSSGRLCYE